MLEQLGVLSFNVTFLFFNRSDRIVLKTKRELLSFRRELLSDRMFHITVDDILEFVLGQVSHVTWRTLSDQLITIVAISSSIESTCRSLRYLMNDLLTNA